MSINKPHKRLRADNVIAEVTRNVDTYEVTSFMVDYQTQQIHIQYTAGHMEGDEMVIVRGSRATVDSDAIFAGDGPPVTKGTLSSNIEAAVYAALMQHLGITGSVS